MLGPLALPQHYSGIFYILTQFLCSTPSPNIFALRTDTPSPKICLINHDWPGQQAVQANALSCTIHRGLFESHYSTQVPAQVFRLFDLSCSW